MRGWPASAEHRQAASGVFPAHAGMARNGRKERQKPQRVPRACGDGPRLVPAVWADVSVFPAHAGMARLSRRRARVCTRVPRACGDGPTSSLTAGTRRLCSPRMRGWPVVILVMRAQQEVFPAHAGMARDETLPETVLMRVPRACGDGPQAMTVHKLPGGCSPRMRGWPVCPDCYGRHAAVFPAHAGMARHAGNSHGVPESVPRACGDGPGGLSRRCRILWCSPRMRGWPDFNTNVLGLTNVFPAHAGMARRKRHF